MEYYSAVDVSNMISVFARYFTVVTSHHWYCVSTC